MPKAEIWAWSSCLLQSLCPSVSPVLCLLLSQVLHFPPFPTPLGSPGHLHLSASSLASSQPSLTPPGTVLVRRLCWLQPFVTLSVKVRLPNLPDEALHGLAVPAAHLASSRAGPHSVPRARHTLTAHLCSSPALSMSELTGQFLQGSSLPRTPQDWLRSLSLGDLTFPVVMLACLLAPGAVTACWLVSILPRH